MAPPPTPSGGWLNQRWHGIPRWGLIGGAGALVIGIYVLKKRAAAASNSTVGGAGGKLPSDLSGYGYGNGAGGAAGGVGSGVLPLPPTPGGTPNTPTSQGMPSGGLQSGAVPTVPAGGELATDQNLGAFGFTPGAPIPSGTVLRPSDSLRFLAPGASPNPDPYAWTNLPGLFTPGGVALSGDNGFVRGPGVPSSATPTTPGYGLSNGVLVHV